MNTDYYEADALISPAFAAFGHIENVNAAKKFIIDLKDSYEVKTAYVLKRAGNLSE